MASSTTDYFSHARPVIRSRQASNLIPGATPGSPRTPQLGRSISGQFGSPGTPYRSEHEDLVVYELGARHLSAGFAGEGRPRCILPFHPDEGRRVGDYRVYGAAYERQRKKLRREEEWGAEHELYRTDIRSLDLGLVEDKLERAVRKVHAEYLQLPSLKPLKAVLAIPSLLPTPLLEIMLKVLFNHYANPPSVQILTAPILACVAAGLRNALVVDIGWEETVVTAVGEYKEVFQRRSMRAGKMLTREMARLLEREVKSQEDDADSVQVSFEYAEDVTRRMGWCRPRDDLHGKVNTDAEAKFFKLPHPSATGKHTTRTLPVFFNRLSEPAETTLFPSSSNTDDHEISLPQLVYTALLALPLDLRALCISRITFTGGVSALPGLKHRLLQEVHHFVKTRGWDPVRNYGSRDKRQQKSEAHFAAKQALRGHADNGTLESSQRHPPPPADSAPQSAAQRPSSLSGNVAATVLARDRPHDDATHPLTQKIERLTQHPQGVVPTVKGTVRGVETLGAWAGASLVAGLRVKGVHEVERDEFLKTGFAEGPGGGL